MEKEELIKFLKWIDFEYLREGEKYYKPTLYTAEPIYYTIEDICQRYVNKSKKLK